MFGRTVRIALVLIATQLSTGCFCCCDRPFFWRWRQAGCGCGCGCQPCTTCCGSPVVGYGPGGPPVYAGPPIAAPVAPVAPAAPVANPALDRMPAISSALMNNSR